MGSETVMMRRSLMLVFVALVWFGGVCRALQPRLKEKLVWQDNFKSSHGVRPDPSVWTYDVGGDGWGNGELETYCAYGSDKSPCDPDHPNAFVGTDGYLHLVARKTADGRYTSARLRTLGRKSFRYGRFEARIKVTSGQGLWPAFWLLGEDIHAAGWPACGELDVMENIGKEPTIIHGSIHGKGFPGPAVGTVGSLPDHASLAAAFHNYGMIWSPGRVAYYIDDPSHPYAVDTPASMPQGGVWPFDNRRFYLLLNLAVGGGWPGNPDKSTRFPAEMLVDYVKVWQLQ